MVEILPGWTPELERSFKEVLFRFLEEVHSTKAALYLCDPEGTFLLITQYGFGRKEMIPTRHEPSAAMVVKAHQGQGGPIAVNNGHDEPVLAELLHLAGTTRMMVVPIVSSERLAGFVDVRDKGQERPFEESDLAAAATIAQDILRLVERTGLVAGVLPKTKRGAPSGEDVVQRPPEGGAVTVLDDIGLEQLHGFLFEQMRLQTCLAAAAVAVAKPDRVGVKVLLAQGAGDDDRSPLLHHQAEALRSIGWEPPPPDVWSVRSEVAPCSLEKRGSRVIGTSIALEQRGWALVVSVVGLAASDEVQRAVTRLVHRAREVSIDAQRRFARRQLSFKLLQYKGTALKELESHSAAVSRLAWATAQELGVGLDQAEEAAVAGILHDVGMRDLDYENLYRHPSPGAEERRIFRSHSAVGEKILFNTGLAGLAAVVRHHHERWDGEGYPDRLAGEAIPLLARVVHAAEVFDVLTATESYRRPVGRERALTMIKKESGRQFDPTVVEALVTAVHRATKSDSRGFATNHE